MSQYPYYRKKGPAPRKPLRGRKQRRHHLDRDVRQELHASG